MSKKANNTLETWGNEATMNLNVVIYQNILSSPYFQSLLHFTDCRRIYNEAPFVKGTQPSTAFCCLFKMWTLKLTVKQLENMIDHPDSPYIRAIGFLYLRYVCAPASLWDWLQYYLEDEEEFAVSGGIKPSKMTIGELCRSLITEQKFQGTMLPRIPVPIARDLEKKLKDYDMEKRSKSSGGHHSEKRDESRTSRGYDRDNSKDRSRERNRDYDSHRSREGSRDYERGRSSKKESRDEFDDYERKRDRRDRSRSRDSYRHRRRSVSPDYRRRDRYSSRDRSRDSRRRSNSRTYSRDR
ncbi:unnamed protein product [Mucor hiemalis]